MVEYQAIQTLSSRGEEQKGERIQDWRAPFCEQLKALNITKETKDFCIFNGKLYKKNGEGLLMRCIGKQEGEVKARQLHETIYGEEGPGCSGCAAHAKKRWKR